MMHLLMLAAALAASPAESELEAMLPEIFAKSAEHYRALDAAATPLMKGDPHAPVPHGAKPFSERRVPHGYKRDKGELDMRSVYWWTAGHYPGSLWYLYEATGDAFFKDRALAWTETLAPNSKVTDNHDIGFVMYCSYGNARRILNTDKYDALLTETAHSLCKRYNEKLGLIRSWGAVDEKRDFKVIPDNLMNLELLEWAANNNRGERFAQIAESHADKTMRHHFRADGGCFHVLDYDQETCRIQNIWRGQGASCETAWSRGESWAIYGYTMMYRETGFNRYLDFAKKLADYAMSHPNMPEDGIPYWDYGAHPSSDIASQCSLRSGDTGEERDSSAGSIMASALLELSQYVDAADRDRYRAFAVKQLLSLASPAYFSQGDEIGHWLLKHGVGSKPAKSEVDTPLDYGDYYFLEGLLRFRKLKAREKAIASVKGISALPRAARLPKDEIDWRFRDARHGLSNSNVVVTAEKILTRPMPDTSDALYGEFWTTGNRTHYEREFFARMKNVVGLTLAERQEGKGRFLPRLEEYIAAICDMKSWVLPAHDWSDHGKGTFHGTSLTTDLFCSEISACLACVVQTVGSKLRPETVDRVKREVERRVFGPVRRGALPSLYPETAIGTDSLMQNGYFRDRECFWWTNGHNNWNAVCWDNIACAACGLIDDAGDRAFFVASADKAVGNYLKYGFEEDGYCSEGMGYWNYGFGHHLLTGRMLDKLTNGRFDFFRRPKETPCAAYARAYTLCDGISPAFADGNGAAASKWLELVDAYWPELPKKLPPRSEFPNGQVWLFRDPDGLSVAFKGGHNGEHHNHNDLGSYYIVDRGRFIAGDAGGEVYTARTFNAHRYESKVLNSYGHPVPVVGGKLQSTGRQFAAKVLSKHLESEVAVVVLDLTGAYEVPALKSLTRTFIYDRKAKNFTVRDAASFSEPTAFETCYVTFGDKPNVSLMLPHGGDVKGGDEVIENPGRKSPHRHAVTFKNPVTEAAVEFTFAHSDS